MSKKQSKATKRANMQAAAQRAAAIRAEQAAKERRNRTLMITGAVVGALILVVAVVVGVQASLDTSGGSAASPEGAVDTYALPMGDSAPVVVTVYEDALCPYCGDFERISSERLKEYAASGEVQVRYHMVSFLDGQSEDRYSTRAANAVGVVLDTAGPEAAVEFHDALFANQPQEGGPGLSDAQMIDLAVDAGAEESEIAGPIEALEFEDWVVNATDTWSKRGFTSTPTVTVNDERIEYQSSEDLLANTEKAVDAALAGQ